MFRYIRSRLEFKILLLIIAVLIIGFGAYVIISIQKESSALLEQHTEKLALFSETIMAGIRNVMVTGKSPVASAFVNDARENLKFGSLTIYDRFGREVFLREGEGIVYHVKEPLLYEAIASHRPQSALLCVASENIWQRFDPIQNRPECWRCHNPKDTLRGVISLDLKSDLLFPSKDLDSTTQIAGTIGNFVASAYRTIMLGGKGPEMDSLIVAVSELPSIRKIQVYDRLGDLHFGKETNEDVPADTIKRFIARQTEEHGYSVQKDKLRLYLPLANQPRCQVCHGSTYPMRGVMVIDFKLDSLKALKKDVEKSLPWVLQTTTIAGLRSIMTVGKASYVRTYIDELRSLPMTKSVRVFDIAGNEHFLNPIPRSRPQISDVIQSKQPVDFTESVGGEEFKVRLSPLLNETRCFVCHGSNHEVRAVVEVSASMKAINQAKRENEKRSAAVGGITILLVWIVLRYFMKVVVLEPVKDIGRVAMRIGEGDFTAHAEDHSPDEIGLLARRINEMVKGLRERFHLEKFVSGQTVNAIRSSDLDGVRLGGERKIATVFFSDIRDFTAYSEKHDPERVVNMLNLSLSKQASIIKEYGGDIDKYVGDELVAVFEGEKMVENAVLAALKIQQALSQSTDVEDRNVINIGVGINTGEMIMGAMGSADRMDYTVIGDNVNLGARLCSAAKGGQILLSEFSAKYLPPDSRFSLVPLEPMIVKGKSAPVVVFEVRKE